jgi:hypothetical protein
MFFTIDYNPATVSAQDAGRRPGDRSTGQSDRLGTDAARFAASYGFKQQPLGWKPPKEGSGQIGEY